MGPRGIKMGSREGSTMMNIIATKSRMLEVTLLCFPQGRVMQVDKEVTIRAID